MAHLVVGPLGSLQVGEQSAIGTPQTAPALELMGQGVTLNVDEPQSRFDEVRGRGIAANDLTPIRTNNTAVLTHPQPLTAEALLLPMHACFGDVTPTTPGSATNAREWLWEFSPEANMEQNLYTFNCVERDEAETPNVYQTQVSDGYLQTLQIQWDATANAVGTVTATYQTNRATYGGTFTAATADQDFNPIPPNMTLSIDDLWTEMIGASPTTELDVYSVDLTLTSGLTMPMRAHGNAAFGYDLVVRSGIVLMTMTLGVYVDTQATGLYREQRALKQGRSRIFAALHGSGGSIETGQPYAIDIGGCFTHMPESLTQHGTVDGDGRATMTIQLQSMHDSVSGHNVFARTRNAAQAFP